MSYNNNLPLTFFSLGEDGDITITAPITLTRDMNYTNLTLESTINSNGYKIFVQSTLHLTSPLASIKNDGTNGEDGAVGGPFILVKKLLR